MKFTNRRNRGFTLIEILNVVALIALIAAIAIPNGVKALGLARRAECLENLRQIQGAKAQWAFENNKQGSAIPADTDLFGPSLYLRTKPKCPHGGTYTLNTVDAQATCTKKGHQPASPAAEKKSKS